MIGTVFILGISSDIGAAMAERYLARGWRVAGTARRDGAPAALRARPGVSVYACDVTDASSVRATIDAFAVDVGVWDTFISAVGTEEPIGPFFASDFDAWERGVIVNSTAQLRVLHRLHPLRRSGATCNVVFFAGGGTNNAFRNYSAYCAAKIFLIKMCELLDDENEDLNVFIVGPGFVRTKIHDQTLAAGDAAGPNRERLTRFFATPGTSMDDIDACIEWCVARGRAVAGGRNFSVVHDPWRRGGDALAAELARNPNKFKLRRAANA